MSNFTIRQDGFSSYTTIPNCFIEQFMPTAAGEFVKIYIYLLKCVEENRFELSIPKIADAFNNTEKDVVRALKYWERKGLLKLTFENDTLTALRIVSLNDIDVPTEPTEVIHKAQVVTDEPKAEVPVAPAVPEKKDYSRDAIDKFSKQDDISLLLFSIQEYLGRPLTGSDTNTVLYCYDTLHFNVDLIEYLFEYCVSGGHKSIRYIEKTALAWAENGISNVKAAKEMAAIYSNNCYPVMKALGIDGRKPTRDESAFVSRWIISYGFDIKIILEACRRTIKNTHQPSFEYTDSILKNWKIAAVSSLEDIKALDDAFEKSQAAAKASFIKKEQAGKSKNDNFNNFSQRSYDFSALEEQLFNQ